MLIRHYLKINILNNKHFHAIINKNTNENEGHNMNKFRYPTINMQLTGKWIKMLCKLNRKSVRMIQEDLGLISVQSIYDWFHGRTLPALDNLYALSKLLNVSMEELLIGEYNIPISWYQRLSESNQRLLNYHTLLK